MEGLHGCPALTVFSLIGSFVVIVMHEDIQVLLDIFNRGVDFFPERHFVKLILDDLVQPFRRSVGLRMPDLRLGMLDSVQMKEELVRVGFDAPAVLGSPVG